MGHENTSAVEGALAWASTTWTSGQPLRVPPRALTMFRRDRPVPGSRDITYGHKALVEAKEARFLSGKPFFDGVESPLDRLNQEAVEVKREILYVLRAHGRPMSARVLAEAIEDRFQAPVVWEYAGELRLAGSVGLAGRRGKVVAPDRKGLG